MTIGTFPRTIAAPPIGMTGTTRRTGLFPMMLRIAVTPMTGMNAQTSPYMIRNAFQNKL